MQFAHFVHLLIKGLAFWGIVNLVPRGRLSGRVIMFVLVAVAFGEGYPLQRRRSG